MNLLERLEDWALDYVPGPIYRIPSRTKDFFRSIKYLFQKIFRKSHASDRELWNFGYTVIKYTYPKLKAFIEMEKNSHPMDFEEYYPERWESEEEYNKAVENGEHTGGGVERWEEILNEMLFAFEFKYFSDLLKEEDFYEKWRLEDPYEEKEENLKITYEYKLADGGGIWTGEPLSEEEVKERGATLKTARDSYLNFKLLQEYEIRAQKGFELFGKYLTTMWD